MLDIHPFCAVHPSAGDAPRVSSVPYDIVNREEAAALAEGNDDSFLHVIRSEIDLPGIDAHADEVYEKAADAYQRLRDADVLFKDDEPSLYAYRQCMGEHVQVGIVACCTVGDYESGVIRRHEKTRKTKEDDRTRHVLETGANTGPVFLAYRDQDAVTLLVNDAINRRPMFHFVADDGITHTGWRIENDAPLLKALRGIPVAYVADGHHRTASAVRAAKERAAANPNHDGSEEYNRFLAVLFPASHLKILPYNRTVADLHGHTPQELLSALGTAATPTSNPTPASSGGCCMYLDGTWYAIQFDPDAIPRDDPVRSLDVDLLQSLVLEPLLGVGEARTDVRIAFVGGIRGTDELERLVDEGEAAVAFSMYPTSIEQLLSVADADLIMPPKSTWFEPKLRSGLFVHEIQEVSGTGVVRSRE
ncbi:MAG: DUF1015 family protein [Phycisphaerales bacterium]|nr:DUF1015 family protein [Phycisphaerales bacterium]